MASAARSSVGQASYDGWVDLDSDGDVDVVDVMRVAAAWDTRCPGTALRAGPANADAPTTAQPIVFIQPSRLLASPGAVVTATVAISGAENLGGYEFRLQFDPAVVSILDIQLGPFLGSTGNTVAPLGGMGTLLTDTLRFGAFSFGANPGPHGAGALAIVTMAVPGRGRGRIDLLEVQVVDKNALEQTLAGVAGGVVDSRLRAWLPVIVREWP